MAVKRRSARQRKDSRLVGYVRVSTEEQAREGVSLDHQRERLEAYAVAHGLELVGIEADNGTSGSIAPKRRPGLARALERLSDGEAEGLVALKLDRLSRSTRDVLDLVDETRRHGWRLVSVCEALDTQTAAGRLVLTVLAALAEMEREQISERTTEALGHVARQGRGRSRFIPFGYRTADGDTALEKGDRRKLVRHAEEQRQLRAMLRQREKGLGARKLAAWLNEQHGGNPRSRRLWTPENVASVLRTQERRAEALG